MGISDLESRQDYWKKNHSFIWQRIYHEHDENPLGSGFLVNSQIKIEKCKFPGRGLTSPTPMLQVMVSNHLESPYCQCCHRYGEPVWVGSFLLFYFMDGGYDDPYLKVYVSVQEGEDWDAKRAIIDATTANVSETGLVTVVLHDGRQFTAELPVPSVEACEYGGWLRDRETE